METRQFMLAYRLTRNSVIHQEFYVTEELARKDANELYRQGFVYIELFVKDRQGGYRSLKRVDQHEGIARAKHEAFVKAAEQDFLDYHHQLFG